RGSAEETAVNGAHAVGQQQSAADKDHAGRVLEIQGSQLAPGGAVVGGMRHAAAGRRSGVPIATDSGAPTEQFTAIQRGHGIQSHTGDGSGGDIRIMATAIGGSPDGVERAEFAYAEAREDCVAHHGPLTEARLKAAVEIELERPAGDVLPALIEHAGL